MSRISKRAEEKKNKKSHIALYILGGLAAFIILAYGIGVYYFSSHFYLNARINGEDVGGFTCAEAEKVFTEDFDSHILTLVERDQDGNLTQTETIDPQDIGVVISVGTQIQDDLENQNEWLWFLGLRGTTDKKVSLDVTYDADELEKTVDGLQVFDEDKVTAPKSAYITQGETQFEIVEEVNGNTVIKDDLITAIGTAFAQCQTELNLDEADVYKKPSRLSTDETMNEALEKANKWAASKITYDFDYTTVTVDYSKFKDWITISKDYKKVTLSSDDVEDYVTKLCSDFNTMGAAHTFTTTGGSTITITDGDYGWKIYYDKEVEKLKKNIKSGKEVTREPVYSYTAMARNSATDDIGDSYVEVSISAQMAYLYVDGELIASSSVVTGDSTKGYDTDTGIYAMTYKQRNATLSGQGYSSPVSYWMPFNGNQGLHDASWRSSFGGSIYQGSGSHGCVNCPYSFAKTLYSYVDEGFPVIVY